MMLLYNIPFCSPGCKCDDHVTLLVSIVNHPLKGSTLVKFIVDKSLYSFLCLMYLP